MPSGMPATTSSTASANSGCRAGRHRALQRQRAQVLAVRRLADDLEADGHEELLGAGVAARPDDGRPVESASAGLVGERLDGEAADAACPARVPATSMRQIAARRKSSGASASKLPMM